jgi:metal-dependent amidase/aminoacylase/carboxypeptidase family protein
MNKTLFSSIAFFIFLCSNGQSSALKLKLMQSRGNRIGVIDWRRDFHQHPELGNREFNSRENCGTSRSLGIEVQTGIAKTGC